MASAATQASDTLTRLTLAGLAVIIVGYFLVSPLALVALGFAYEDTGGGPLEKIHPATVFAALVLGLTGLGYRPLIKRAATAALRETGASALVAATLFLILYAVVFLRQPFTLLIDTFLAPAIVLFLARQVPATELGRLAPLLHAIILSNAVLGIFEFLFDFRLTPLIANGVEVSDWRSTAFFGHPLGNASITGAYMIALATGASRRWPTVLQCVAFALSAAGLVVFGGRASLVLTGAILLILFAVHGARILHGARFDQRRLLTLTLMLPVAFALLLGLAEAGFFDRLAERFIDDDGSASTRVAMFELFKHFSWPELLLKPDPDYLGRLKVFYGLEFGIESFWVSFILYFGLIPSLLLFVAIYLYCRDLVRATSPAAIWLLLQFFAVASTSVSLSAKSPLLAQIALLVLILLAPKATVRAQPRLASPLHAGTRVSPRRPLIAAQ